MRLINLMTLICVLLFLAMIPAFVHFAQATGTPRSASAGRFCRNHRCAGRAAARDCVQSPRFSSCNENNPAPLRLEVQGNSSQVL